MVAGRRNQDVITRRNSRCKVKIMQDEVVEQQYAPSTRAKRRAPDQRVEKLVSDSQHSGA